MFKKILIANDGSEGAFKALVAALRLAHSHKAEAHMICVEEIPWMHAGSREEVVSEKEVADHKFAEVVAKAEAEAKHHRVKLVSHIVIGRPAAAIVAFIAVHCSRASPNRLHSLSGRPKDTHEKAARRSLRRGSSSRSGSMTPFSKPQGR